MKFLIERDTRTREIQIVGPDGFAHTLNDNMIAAHGFHAVSKLLEEAYEAGYKNGFTEGVRVREALETKRAFLNGEGA